MPWQEQVALVGGEIDSDTGLPAYRSVVVTVPRQNGKTMLILSWELQRAIGWDKPQRIVYSAQSGTDARQKLLNDQAPILERRQTALGIKRILRANGSEGVQFNNGSLISILASTEESGHGPSVDLGIKDEFFADADDRRDQALIPAMATRADGQVVTASTAGTEASLPLNRAIESGRTGVDAGLRTGTAYFEWSALEGSDPEDPKTWWGCMPALGHTITEGVVRHAFETLEIDEFYRAFLNIKTGTTHRVIPIDVWESVCETDRSKVKLTGLPSFGLDLNEERTSASIAVCAGDVIDIIETNLTPSEAVEKAAILGRKSPVHLAARSPASTLAEDIRAKGGQVTELSSEQLVDASGEFYDAVSTRQLTIWRNPVLDHAVANARKRNVGDGAFVWARKGSSADVSPLIAATVARWGAKQPQQSTASTYEEKDLLVLG